MVARRTVLSAEDRWSCLGLNLSCAKSFVETLHIKQGALLMPTASRTTVNCYIYADAEAFNIIIIYYEIHIRE